MDQYKQSLAYTRRLEAMLSAKEQMAKIIQEQPDDSSYDEVLRELAFARMIERGLEDSQANRTISNNEMKHRIMTWRK
jgi:hypothetical protein